jgi:hypothetical protein
MAVRALWRRASRRLRGDLAVPLLRYTTDGSRTTGGAAGLARCKRGQPPEGFPPAELIAPHDPEADQSLVIVIFQTEDDYERGDEILSAMPVGDTPGRRTSVKKYNVATRMKS